MWQREGDNSNRLLILVDCVCANMCAGAAVKDYSLIKILWASHSLLQLWDKEGTCGILWIPLTAACMQNTKWRVCKSECEVRDGGEKCLRRRQGHKQTHFFVVFDFIFRDDAVGLLGLLPGELDAALLHFLLDDLADLGRRCLDKNTSISWGQTFTCTQPDTDQQRESSNNTRLPWELLNAHTSWYTFQLQCKRCLIQWKTTICAVDYKYQFQFLPTMDAAHRGYTPKKLDRFTSAMLRCPLHLHRSVSCTALARKFTKVVQI